MGLPNEDNFHHYEQGSLIRKAKKLAGKELEFFLAHGMADANVHLQNSMVLAKELVKYNVSFQQQVNGLHSHILKCVHACTKYSLNQLEKVYAHLTMRESKQQKQNSFTVLRCCALLY